MSNKLLSIKNLELSFKMYEGTLNVLKKINLELEKGEKVALVGESGSGKSVTSLSINRLIPDPPGKIVGGEILYKNNDLLKLTYDEMKDIRGK